MPLDGSGDAITGELSPDAAIAAGGDASLDSSDAEQAPTWDPVGQCYRTSPNLPCAPSCQSIDGLTAGASLSIEILQDSRPESSPSTCFGYKTEWLQGVSGVTLGTPSYPYDNALTSCWGTFVSPTEQGCQGSWTLSVEPESVPAPGTLISPIDASAGSFYVVRTIYISQVQFCGGGYTTRGPLTCQDTFIVTTIAELGDP
jgi:hypothetical protein